MFVYFLCVYIFAIYFIYIDKKDCEIFSHAEYVTRPEHVQEDILIIINSAQNDGLQVMMCVIYTSISNNSKSPNVSHIGLFSLYIYS